MRDPGHRCPQARAEAGHRSDGVAQDDQRPSDPNQVDRDRAGEGVGLRPGLPAEARRRNQIVNFGPQTKIGEGCDPPHSLGVVERSE
jgi:hypothetical protein